MVTGSVPGPVRVKGRHQTTHGICEGFLGERSLQLGLEEQQESADGGKGLPMKFPQSREKGSF